MISSSISDMLVLLTVTMHLMCLRGNYKTYNLEYCHAVTLYNAEPLGRCHHTLPHSNNGEACKGGNWPHPTPWGISFSRFSTQGHLAPRVLCRSPQWLTKPLGTPNLT